MPAISSAIDPQTLDCVAVKWAAAFRLRPMAMPSAPTLAVLGEDEQDLLSLIDVRSPRARHDTGAARHNFTHHALMPSAVRSAFAHPSPEWRFALSATPHMVVCQNIRAAVCTASEQYGQFLKDTEQAACQLSFAMERYVLSGDFFDARDTDTFSACYGPHALDGRASAAQDLVADLGAQGADGLLYTTDEGSCAVVLNPDCVRVYAKERALAMQWDGNEFTRYFDYRDLHWVGLSSG
ncbi:MAG: hypothetical protein JKY34_02760 [Kordiimonadaceae bacterium]|nr:hypothetical protein [Kordiimonadaceae bacterium]